MGGKFAEYRLVQDSKLFNVDDEYPFPISNVQRSWSRYRRTKIGFLVLILSVALNVVEHFQLCQQKTLAVEASRSKFAGLQANVEIPYQYKTEYSGENETLANELWEAINSTSAGAIALDHHWAASKGLIRAQDFPWDREKGIYYVQGIHDIHCVKLLRRSIFEYHHALEQTVNHHHLVHCLDAFRLRFMCMADDTPLATQLGRAHETGQGQMQHYRDWDALVSWAHDPKRHACYGQVNEYLDAEHNLERFRFCKDASPFRASKDAYFEEHGHQDLF